MEAVFIGNLFGNVKQFVSVPEAAERYGLTLSHNHMACCPFHPDRHPSMKVNEDYYYCFSCGEHGDVIDLAAKLLELRPKDAALQLAADFHVPIETERGRISRTPTPKRRDYKAEEDRCFRVLTHYCHRLKEWEEAYQPQSDDEEWHPLFTEALQQREYMEYIVERLIEASSQERRELMEQLKGRVDELEERFHGDKFDDHQ
jgi:hypothetical protein